MFTFLPGLLLLPLFKIAQVLATAKSRHQRQAVLKSDDWLEEILGFAGESL